MPFMGLPLELRLVIYEFVLVQPVQPMLMVKMQAPTARKRRRNNRVSLHPEQPPVFVSSKSILAVCRNIDNEAFWIHYRCNHFLCYTSVKRIDHFLKSLGRRCRHQITKLTIVVPVQAGNCISAALCTLLKDCIRLSSLRLHYEGRKLMEQLGGLKVLLKLCGMTITSITRRRSTSTYNEQCQQDSTAPFPDAHRCVEIQTHLACRLRTAWSSPRPVCRKCEGIGNAC